MPVRLSAGSNSKAVTERVVARCSRLSAPDAAVRIQVFWCVLGACAASSPGGAASESLR